MEELQRLFIDECQRKWGSNPSTDYDSHIETIDSPYAFQSMEWAINHLKKEYLDVSSQQNIERMNKELIDVNNIMKENFDLLLNRENTLKGE